MAPLTDRELVLGTVVLGLAAGLLLAIWLTPRPIPLPLPVPAAPVVRYESVWPGVGAESVVMVEEDGWHVLKVLRGGGYAGELMRFNAAERVFVFGKAPANWQGRRR